ncbi:MAG TPA: cob(I)yrinic acid a,c-diamide adenosyltransferase [Microlunatus sp.]
MVTTAVSSPLNGTLVPAGALTGRDAVPVATYSQSVPAGAWESSGAGSTVLAATEPGAEGTGVVAGVDAGVDGGEEVGVPLADAVRDGEAEADSSGAADWGIRPQPASTTSRTAQVVVRRSTVTRSTLPSPTQRARPRRAVAALMRRVWGVVHLTRIYTKTGDGGQTRLADMSETSKTDPRVEAYGDVDEANSLIGVALATAEMPVDITALLRLIQNELFDLGADLATPVVANPRHPPLRITPEYVERLEGSCDRFGDPLPDLRSFILPGGSLAAAHLHVARTVVRRAERAGWQAVERYGTETGADGGPGGVNPLALTYLNRLSDLLFILTRVVNTPSGDILWKPGGDREHP